MYPDCYIVIAGKLNVNLDDEKDTRFSIDIIDFIESHILICCDAAFVYDVSYIYCNEALNQFSKLDYCIISEKDYIIDLIDFDSGNTNFSDHIPLVLICYYCKSVIDINTSANNNVKSKDVSTVMPI